ncbi:ABC transporter permease [Nonomuraea sp. NPDC050643]|uniref:ABC transporter permease n=1 Tax=Nonomuraea sp. NPDC050643 TaxID=3155660 RepID=UPI0033D6F4E5
MNALRLARLDLRLLWRNRTSLFLLVAMPVVITVILAGRNRGVLDGVDAVLYVGTGQMALFLLFSVFVNLAGVFTVRREEMVLKRLRGSVLSPAEIFTGSGLAATGLLLVQVLALLVFLAASVGGPMPANVPLLVTGLAGGVVVCVALALIVSGLTPRSELTQITTLPVTLACMATSGAYVPIGALPDLVEKIAEFLPLTSVLQIVRTAYFGRDLTTAGVARPVGAWEGFVACLPQIGIVAAWCLVAAVPAALLFRWERRRS